MNNKIAICQDVFGKIRIRDILEIIQKMGYEGLELAPFMLAEDIRNLPRDEIIALKKEAIKYSIELVAAHWLLASPKGLHITKPDRKILIEPPNILRR